MGHHAPKFLNIFSLFFFSLFCLSRRHCFFFLSVSVRVLFWRLCRPSSRPPFRVRLQQQLAAAAAAAAATQRPPTLSPSLASVLSRNSQSTVSGSNKKKTKKITTTTTTTKKSAKNRRRQKKKNENFLLIFLFFFFKKDGRFSSYYFFKFFPWISIEDHIFAFRLRHELIYLFSQLTQNERRWEV